MNMASRHRLSQATTEARPARHESYPQDAANQPLDVRLGLAERQGSCIQRRIASRRRRRSNDAEHAVQAVAHPAAVAAPPGRVAHDLEDRIATHLLTHECYRNADTRQTDSSKPAALVS
jgi:hypothetical protein